MMEQNDVMNEHIPHEQFEFVQRDGLIHDKKLETKSRGFMADAFIRFKKNKSSVVAGCIIGILILYALIVPAVSPYDIKTDKDKVYTNCPPFIPAFAEAGIPLFDGSVRIDSQNEKQMQQLIAIGEETGYNPLLRQVGTTSYTVRERGKDVEKYTYSIMVNRYYRAGIKIETISVEKFQELMDWQDETGLQVICPWVEPGDTGLEGVYLQDSSIKNIWYRVDSKGLPILKTLEDSAEIEAYKASGRYYTVNAKNKNYIDVFDPLYCTDKSVAGTVEYTSSIRQDGDPGIEDPNADGAYVYCCQVSGAVKVRLNYYNYYRYLNGGDEPVYLFGTTVDGQDMFTAVATGARFSLVFAIIVSAINLFIGTVYGAIQGYYGGAVDIILDRITDILSEVPFVVVTTLFQLHLQQKVGPVISFLFAFVLTGWIGMAALTRKQFYRFKSQEHILAARTLGAGDWRLMFKHIFPNAIGTIITSCALVIPGVISSETNMTYLGIVNLSEFAGTSIGVLMSNGQASMQTAPHAMLFPALFYALLLISFNLFGNGLRDAFNPTMRGAEG